MTEFATASMIPGQEGRAIVVPREIVNAESVYVVQWVIPDGGRVHEGCAVCEIETSKATVTVESPESGFLRHQAVIGAEVPVGGILGYIMGDLNTPRAISPSSIDAPAASSISAKARRKIEELGLDIGQFANKGLVREEDVLAMAAQQPPAITEVDMRGIFDKEALGPVQRRVARAMEKSAAEIPAAYLERTFDLEVVRKHAQEITRDSKVLISVVDLVVSAVARACVQFRQFNSCFMSELDVRIFNSVHVGVAVDVDNDLYVVVVKEAHAKQATEIAKELRNLQYLAQRRRLAVDHLIGGTITVTSLLGRGIHRFQPLLFPQQSAIVGITDAEANGTGRLTLGFDHRLANGSLAAGFLAAIERGLNS